MSFASTQPEFDELYAGAVQEVFAIMHQSRPVS
jgi:hypothetical protein